MRQDVSLYEKKIEEYGALMSANSRYGDIRLAEDHWTLKEMIGHLVDSASNNHQRFVRLQLQEELVFPGYGEEDWRRVSRVNDLDYRFLTDFWRSCNQFLIHLIRNMEPESLNHVWKSPGGDLTLGFLVEDYFGHMDWHMDLFERRAGEIRKSGQAG